MRIDTQEDARNFFDYAPDVGALIWRPRPVEHFKDASYQLRWNNRCAGKSAENVGNNGYLRINLAGRMYLVHRIVWLWVNGSWPTGEIDHINGCRTDNRIANLREVAHAENARNAARPSTNTSGVIGVSYDARDGLWHAYIGRNRPPKIPRLLPDQGRSLRSEAGRRAIARLSPEPREGSMNVEFFPRSQVMNAFVKGWRLIPAHPYQTGDYAVLLYKPEKRTKVTRNLMEAWASGLDRPRRETLGNRTWGARSFREGLRATEFASTAGA